MMEEGLGRLDEAMAAATGGETEVPETFGGSAARRSSPANGRTTASAPRQWAQASETFARILLAQPRPFRRRQVLEAALPVVAGARTFCCASSRPLERRSS